MAAPDRQALQIQGLEALDAAFDQLAAYAQKDAVVDALKVGADMVTEAGQALAPEDEGKLVRAIRTRVGRKGKGSFSVLSAAGKRWFKGEAFYGAFQEFGWKTGKRGSANRKQIPGEHFMEHAFEEKAAAAMEAVLQKLRAGIEEEVIKARQIAAAGNRS